MENLRGESTELLGAMDGMLQEEKVEAIGAMNRINAIYRGLRCRGALIEKSRVGGRIGMGEERF